ncbi:Zn-ribbon domain-containing OB-fold protein [Amycolatopsis nivea]
MTVRINPVARDEESAAFFDGTAAGEFRLLRRRSTGEYLDPRTVADPDDDLEWTAAAGTGTVVSWSVVHKRARDGGEPERVVVGIVELTEGPWWWCRLDADPDADLWQLPVRAVFVPSGPEPDHEKVPVFAPAEEDGHAR